MRDSFYLLELFSGNGTVSRIVSKVLGVKAIRIDMDPDADADITMDLTQWDEAAAAQVRRLAGATAANRKRAVVWASPPCTEYTRLKTRGQRNLAAADACVAVVARIAADLDAAVVLIENPATGLLKERDVIQAYPHSVQLDYCQYGYAYRKRTMLWSSLPLPASFPVRTCPGYPHCACTFKNAETGKICHVINMCKDEDQAQRISVPDQLSCLVGRALAELLPGLAHAPAPPPTPSQKARQQTSWVVDYIEQACMDRGVLKLQVAWVGYDRSSWITWDELNAPPAEYDFISAELLHWVEARYNALQQRQQAQQQQQEAQPSTLPPPPQRRTNRKRRQGEQQQQQRRATRSRNAASSSSSSSSGSSSSGPSIRSSSSSTYTDPLLADGYGP